MAPKVLPLPSAPVPVVAYAKGFQVKYIDTTLYVVALRKAYPVRITYTTDRDEALTWTTFDEAAAAVRVMDLLGAGLHKIVVEP